MVEMTEMANILRNATHNSLVLVDEIGRGTSTYDGLSLAWACALDLAQRLKAYSLFATHYFEITELAEQLSDVNNVHLDAVEHGQDIVFMYHVKDGPANQSYGIQVARLAGLPTKVLATAEDKLKTLELEAHNSMTSGSGQHSIDFSSATVDHESILEKKLQSIDPDELNARQALDLLYELKSVLN